MLFFLVCLKFCSKMIGTLIHYIKQHNHFLKLSFDGFITCNIFNITSCIDMDSFSTTSKAVILVAIYIVLCLRNKTFVIGFRNILYSFSNCCGKSTKNLAALMRFFFHHLPDFFFRYNVIF